VIGRRDFLAGLSATGLAAGCATSGAAPPVGGTIYAPAPPATPLHALNLQLGEALAREGLARWRMEPLALPESVNRAAALPDAQRTLTLPIVTTADFVLARSGSGPDWHGYDQARQDLLFVSTLYDVGFGFEVADPAIRAPTDLAGRAVAVPPRPSAVRMMSEALVDAGWNIAGVHFVDTTPPQAARMLASGEVAASAWNLILPGTDGFAPMLPSPPGSRWLPVEPDAIAAMNAASGFRLGGFAHPGHGAIVSFAQALSAWVDTPAATLAAMLAAIARHGPVMAGLPGDREGMLRWPGLVEAEIHPAARAFHAPA